MALQGPPGGQAGGGGRAYYTGPFSGVTPTLGMNLQPLQLRYTAGSIYRALTAEEGENKPPPPPFEGVLGGRGCRVASLQHEAGGIPTLGPATPPPAPPPHPHCRSFEKDPIGPRIANTASVLMAGGCGEGGKGKEASPFGDPPCLSGFWTALVDFWGMAAQHAFKARLPQKAEDRNRRDGRSGKMPGGPGHGGGGCHGLPSRGLAPPRCRQDKGSRAKLQPVTGHTAMAKEGRGSQKSVRPRPPSPSHTQLDPASPTKPLV